MFIHTTVTGNGSKSHMKCCVFLLVFEIISSYAYNFASISNIILVTEVLNSMKYFNTVSYCETDKYIEMEMCDLD